MLEKGGDSEAGGFHYDLTVHCTNWHLADVGEQSEKMILDKSCNFALSTCSR